MIYCYTEYYLYTNFRNNEGLVKDKIITDVISVINNSKKIDVLALVRIRADMDCIIMVSANYFSYRRY